jgi:hypothetical protein
MSLSEPTPSDPTPPSATGPGASARPDWLTDATEGASAAPLPERETWKPAPPPASPVTKATEPPAPSEAKAEDAAPSTGPKAWKAAASSVPRLSRVTAVASRSENEAGDAFPGFAQDEIVARAGTSASGEGAARRLLGEEAASSPIDGAPYRATPASWIDQLKTVSPVIWIAAGVVLVGGLVTTFLLSPRGEPSVSLAQIRQHPEAFEGRAVRVSGVAGEAFAVGTSYVYDLRQSRDTIVVYSKSRPVLHERVAVHGTVSIGYMDGAPRVALLEDASH